MNTCHLMKKRDLKCGDLKCLQNMETLIEESHFDLSLSKCSECGQLYICCFKEICLSDGNDDCWNFWLPVSSKDVNAIRRNKSVAINLINSRSHITHHPDGKLFKRKSAEIALVLPL